MASVKSQLASVSELIQDLTDTTVRLKTVGNESPIVYQELVDLIQSQFRHVESDLQAILFEIEDTSSSGSEKEQHLAEIEKINENVTMYVSSSVNRFNS